jgi:hypothetical protein
MKKKQNQNILPRYISLMVGAKLVLFFRIILLNDEYFDDFLKKGFARHMYNAISHFANCSHVLNVFISISTTRGLLIKFKRQLLDSKSFWVRLEVFFTVFGIFQGGLFSYFPNSKKTETIQTQLNTNKFNKSSIKARYIFFVDLS